VVRNHPLLIGNPRSGLEIFRKRSAGGNTLGEVSQRRSGDRRKPVEIRGPIGNPRSELEIFRKRSAGGNTPGEVSRRRLGDRRKPVEIRGIIGNPRGGLEELFLEVI
jgi:hypothetical protein